MDALSQSSLLDSKSSSCEHSQSVLLLGSDFGDNNPPDRQQHLAILMFFSVQVTLMPCTYASPPSSISLKLLHQCCFSSKQTKDLQPYHNSPISAKPLNPVELYILYQASLQEGDLFAEYTCWPIICSGLNDEYFEDFLQSYLLDAMYITRSQRALLCMYIN